MATTTSLEMQTQLSSENLNLEGLVTEPTWRDILIELVRNNKIDPWDIDIVEVVDRYIDAVKRMKVLDLRVPANIILAAAILLRLKSEMLRMEEEQQAEAVESVERPPITVEGLSFRLRVPPKRRVTLVELISALEEAMKLKELREVEQRGEQIEIPIKINPVDIEAETRNVYKQIRKSVDGSRMTTFSILSKLYANDTVLLQLFIPLLFLAHEKKITLIQERFFEEIVVALN